MDDEWLTAAVRLPFVFCAGSIISSILMSRLTFRWLGVAGIELNTGEQILAIDPFLTRPPLRRLLFGRHPSDRALAAQKIPRCDFILVSHAHFDHLLDVPSIVAQTGARVYGSPNTCRLLAAAGVPADKVNEIKPGDEFTAGDFRVTTMLARHMRVPLFGPARLPARVAPPQGLRDYRMDMALCFLIEAGGYRILNWSNERTERAVAADALFVAPFRERAYYEALLPAVQPRVLVPVHWDDFFRPLSQSIRPMLRPPTWRAPLGYIRLDEFGKMIAAIAPDCRVMMPEIFQTYALAEVSR